MRHGPLRRRLDFGALSVTDWVDEQADSKPCH
jgi:hypothetical protein